MPSINDSLVPVERRERLFVDPLGADDARVLYSSIPTTDRLVGDQLPCVTCVSRSTQWLPTITSIAEVASFNCSGSKKPGAAGIPGDSTQVVVSQPANPTPSPPAPPDPICPPADEISVFGEFVMCASGACVFPGACPSDTTGPSIDLGPYQTAGLLGEGYQRLWRLMDVTLSLPIYFGVVSPLGDLVGIPSSYTVTDCFAHIVQLQQGVVRCDGTEVWPTSSTATPACPPVSPYTLDQALSVEGTYELVKDTVDEPPEGTSNWNACRQYVWACSCDGSNFCQKITLTPGDFTAFVLNSFTNGIPDQQYLFRIDFVGTRVRNAGTPSWISYQPSSTRYKIYRLLINP